MTCPLSLFRRNSIAGVFASVMNGIFKFGTLHTLHLRSLQVPATCIGAFRNPPRKVRIRESGLGGCNHPLLKYAVGPGLKLSTGGCNETICRYLHNKLSFAGSSRGIGSRPFVH